jgi:hypothetical protein
MESYLRRHRGITTPYTVADAVATLVKFREPVEPNPAWREAYQRGLQEFRQRVPGRPDEGKEQHPSRPTLLLTPPSQTVLDKMNEE